MMTFSFMMTWKSGQYLNIGRKVVPYEWILQLYPLSVRCEYTSILQANVVSQEYLCLNKLG